MIVVSEHAANENNYNTKPVGILITKPNLNNYNIKPVGISITNPIR